MKKVLLAILDGWGLNPHPEVSAIAAAHTPVMDRLQKQYPSSTLTTFGEEVGLPEGQMGNSEVGHLNIGAGRIVYQDFTRINRDIRSGALAQNKNLSAFMASAKKSGRLHLMGLLSDGGVHSHINHLKEICTIAASAKIDKVYIHAFLDGRDTSPNGGSQYMKDLLDHIDQWDHIHLATVIGRYYSMDRDNRWERTAKAYDLLVHGKADIQSSDILATIKSQYDQGVTDEFMPAILLEDPEECTLRDKDHAFFFNFRTDRPRQLTQVLTQHSLHGMIPLDIQMATMTEYDSDFMGLTIIYQQENLQMTLGEVLSQHSKTQLRIAETEKYPHVSYFFNGGREEPFAGEHRIMVNSPKVATYDLQPEMSAPLVCNQLLDYIQANNPDFVCLNFANADMVGHTGNFDAAVKAAETVDELLGKILVSLPSEYETLIIADHGNSDIMINPDGSAHTAHTTNPVPIVLVTDRSGTLREGILADVAPTILSLLGIEIPSEMSGSVLYTSS